MAAESPEIAGLWSTEGLVGTAMGKRYSRSPEQRARLAARFRSLVGERPMQAQLALVALCQIALDTIGEDAGPIIETAYGYFTETANQDLRDSGYHGLEIGAVQAAAAQAPPEVHNTIGNVVQQ